MIYLILLILVFIYAVLTGKQATKKHDALCDRVVSLEETVIELTRATPVRNDAADQMNGLHKKIESEVQNE